MLCCAIWASDRLEYEERCLPPWIRRRADSGTEVRRERRVVRFAIDVSVGRVNGIAMNRYVSYRFV